MGMRLLLLFAVQLVSFVRLTSVETAEELKPNIVFFLADDLVCIMFMLMLMFIYKYVYYYYLL